VDKFTYLFSEEKRDFMAKLFTVIFGSPWNEIGCPGLWNMNDSSSLKEQSLVREMKVCSHLKALRISPGNWGKVGAA
jgi:hypothetical protein